MIRVLSFGAGRQTVALARMALAGLFEPLDAMVFADTGAELPGTYRHADMIEAACLERGVKFVRVRNQRPRSSGDLLADLMQPNSRGRWSSPPLFIRDRKGDGFTRRQCTGDFKIDPIGKAVRELAGVGRRRKFAAPVLEHWIGISADERQRMRVADRPWFTLRYPLVERGLRLGDCIEYLNRHGHEVPPKSACFFCPYQSDKRWRELRDHHPGEWDRAVALDEHLRTNREAMGLHGTPYLHRSRRPLAQAVFDETPDLFADECSGNCGV
jgi:hypothetical protein